MGKDRAFGEAGDMVRTGRTLEQAREHEHADEWVDEEDWKFPLIGGRRGRGRGRGRGQGRSPSKKGRKRNLGQNQAKGDVEGDAGKSAKRQKKRNVGDTQAKEGGERKTAVFPRRVPKGRRKDKEKTDFL